MTLNPIKVLDDVIGEYRDYLVTEFRAKDAGLRLSLERELDILKAKAPDLPAELSRQVAAFVQTLRGEDLFKKPGVAETIDWAAALAALDTIALTQEGPDRVRVDGVRGLPAPPMAKVCINLDGGFRNRMTFALTGSHQRAKAEWLETALFSRLGGKARFDEVDVRLVEAPAHAATQEQAPLL